MTLAEFTDFIEGLKRNGGMDRAFAESSQLLYRRLTQAELVVIDITAAQTRVSKEVNDKLIAILYRRIVLGV